MKTSRSKRQTRTEDGTPHPVDVHVGQRLRRRRTELGWSQGKLGAELGLTFQQIQKYERGANRIGASRLWEISRALNVPESYFFENAPQTVAGFSDAGQEGYSADPGIDRETASLLRAFQRIEDHKLRRRLIDLTRSIADVAESD